MGAGGNVVQFPPQEHRLQADELDVLGVPVYGQARFAYVQLNADGCMELDAITQAIDEYESAHGRKPVAVLAHE